jgi:hypothetical protein
LSDFESVDFFTDPSLIPDPYPYFDHLRERCPVMSRPEPLHYTIIAAPGYPQRTNSGLSPGTFCATDYGRLRNAISHPMSHSRIM